MNRNIRTLLIVGLCLVLVGAALIGFALFRVGFDFQELNVPKDTVSEPHSAALPAGDYRSIVITGSTGDLKILPAEGDEILLSWEDNENYAYTLDTAGSELRLTGESRRSGTGWRNWFRISFTDDPRTVTLALPPSYAGSVTGTLSTGDIRTENVALSGPLTLSASTGDVFVRDLAAPETALRTSTGRITVSNAETGAFTASSSTGDILLDGTRFSSASLNASTGELLCTLPGAEDDYRIEADTSTGDVTIGGTHRSSAGNGGIPLTLKTSTGDILVSFEG